MLAGRKVAVRMIAIIAKMVIMIKVKLLFMTKAIDKNQTWLPT